uniref:Major facilitator superfamily (MFS) profile domain-containing protein n=1 Tax=Manihot esculenta TaxID=3983 RepID=A0A2C9U339_MANES
MATIGVSGSESPESIQTSLLNVVVEGFVDYRGLPTYRSNSWGWTSASFILVSPFIADSCLGRYRTIVVGCVICILGLGLLTLSTTISSFSASSGPFQVVFFFFSLYLVAFGQGGYKPCVQAFGADQFDERDPKESIDKNSFFNWWYFSMCSGILVARLILIYIQDNLNWTFGFGIPCIVMVIALFIFLLGSKTYRYSIKVEEKSAFQRIRQVFVATIRNWRSSSAIALEEEACQSLPHHSSDQFI